MRHKNNNRFLKLLTPVVFTLLLIAAAAVAPASAAVTTYTSRSTYNSVAAPMGTTKNIDFATRDDALPITNPANDINVTSMYLKGAEFVNQRSYYNRMFYNFPNFKSRVNLPANTYAFGVDLTRFYGTNGNFTVRLSTGDVYTFAGKPNVHYFTFPPNPDFFGVISDQPVQWAEYSFPNDYFVLDDFTFTVNTPNQLSGLVSYWSAENTSIDVKDGNDGIMRGGMVFSNGAVGKAFNFDGANRYVEVPDSANLSLTGPLTLEARIKLNSNSTQQAIIEKYDVPGLNGYLMRIQGGKLAAAMCNPTLAGAQSGVIGATTVTTGVWHHVAAVYDGTTLKVYLDGVLDGSVPANFAPTNGAASLKIGARGDDAATRFNGLIDDARIYNRALTEAEIQTLMVYDTTPPVITPAVTGNQGDNNWYRSNVQVSWTVADGESNVDSSDGCGVSNVTTDTAGVTFTCTATSLGGTSTQTVTIKRDSTPPNMLKTATLNGNPYNGGWTNQDVFVNFDCTDSLSGMRDQSEPTIVNGEGANQTVQGTCFDQAGNGVVDVYGNINIDKTAPEINADRTPAANAAGWNNTNVTANYTASDALSGLAANSPASGSLLFSAEGAGQSFTFSVTDLAGNSATATVQNINIDKTAPNVNASATVNGSPYVSGAWTNLDVLVNFNCTDGLSGVDQSTSPATFSNEGAGQSANGSCSDLAGNSASTAFSGINIDKTAPLIDVDRTPAANAAGWNNTNVSANYSASDALSGLSGNSPATGSFEFTAEGAGQSHTFTVWDAAGNSASASVQNVNIDKTAPQIDINRTPPANGAGWNNTNVTAEYNASDALSGLSVNSPANGSYTFTAEGAGQSYTFTVTDAAGNSASASVHNVNIDKTAPTVNSQATVNGLPYMAGVWTKQNVLVSFNCTDGLSGVGVSTSPVTVSGEGANQSSTGACSDLAGNSSETTFSGINIDKTAPLIDANRTPAANAAGWNNGDVTADYSASDALSGLSNNSPATGSHIFTAEGAGQAYTFTVADAAGNSASVTIENVNIDKTAPTLGTQATVNGQPYAAGVWTNRNVVVSFDCSDALSGVGNSTAPVTVSAEGANQSANGTCTDQAGNSSETTFSGIFIDKTAPDINADRTPAANAAGWNNGDVTASYNASDALSGLGVNSPASGSHLFGTEGAGQSHTFTVTDAAGNSASVTVQNVNIDKSAPSVNCGAADGLWHAADVSIACTSSDSLSTLANSADANFNLVTSVAAGTETSNASTDSRQVCDKAGNCASSSSVGGNKVDKKAPSITITSPTAGSYLLNQAVAVNYSCTDGGAGVGSCTGTSPNGGLLDTSGIGAKTFTVSAVDNVGNQATPSSVNYTVGFGLDILFDHTKAHKAGSTVPIKVRLTDANGNNLSSAGTVLHAVSVVQIGSQASTMLEDAGNSNPDFDFRFDQDSASYVYNLQTKGYRTGTYQLNFIAGSGAVIYSVRFQVRQ